MSFATVGAKGEGDYWRKCACGECPDSYPVHIVRSQFDLLAFDFLQIVSHLVTYQSSSAYAPSFGKPNISSLTSISTRAALMVATASSSVLLTSSALNSSISRAISDHS